MTATRRFSLVCCCVIMIASALFAEDWHYGKYQYGYNSKSIPLVSKTRFGDAFQVAAAGYAVYFSSSAENKIYALDAASGTIRWTFFTDAAQYSG